MDVDWSSRQLKEKARDRALDFSAKKEVILLPGANLCCLRRGIETGILNKGTVCHLVERNRTIFNMIKRSVDTLPVDARLFHGELHHLRLKSDIDFAFIDLNGPFTIDLLLWMIDELSPKVEGADLSFTVAYAFRNNRLAHACKEFFAETSENRDFHYETSIKFGIGDQTAVMWMSVLRLILFRYNFNLKHKCYYRDKTPMLMVALSELKIVVEREDALWDIRRSFGRFLNHFRRFGMNAKQKAQTTRKRNIKKRSNAATKAWETRRANAAAKKRSVAAKKAWVTRRSAS